MRRALLFVVALAGCSSSSGNPASPADAGGAGDDASDAAPSLDDPPIPARYQPFADAFDAERAKLGAPGAAVAILENGELTFFHGFGTKGPNSADPVRARTLFRIGSMTKTLTATAVLSLEDEGKLDDAATLKSVTPDVALGGAGWDTLTIHQLLTHQSGLYDYFAVSGPTDDGALASFLTSNTFGSHEYFMVAPGTFWNYANPNYALLGLVIERAGGARYRDAIAQRVLAPLGMARTFFLATDVAVDGDWSNGKSTDANGQPWDVAPGAYENAWARPAGYAFSNVLDLARFVRFLHAGDAHVLSDARRAAMETSQVTTLEIGSVEGYGDALYVDRGFRLGTDFYGVPIVHHGGDIPGFAGDFFLVPSTGFGLVTLANADGAHFASSIATALTSFAQLPAPGPVPAELTPDPTTFGAYAGAYLDPFGVIGRVTITVDASHAVTIACPDLDAAKITYDATLAPATTNNFLFKVQGTPLLLTFVAGGNGSFAWLRSRLFVASRQAAAARPVAIDPARLRERLRARL